MCVFIDDEVLLLLRAAIKREGSRAAFAKSYGVDSVYLSMVLSGGRPVGSTILKALGLRKAYVAELMPTDCDNITITPHPASWPVEETLLHKGELVSNNE
jgi:hypothetical protein